MVNMKDTKILSALIGKFIAGEDKSVNCAKAIEAEMYRAFPDSEEMLEIAEMLASYRPGGKPYLYDQDQINRALAKVLNHLSR